MDGLGMDEHDFEPEQPSSRSPVDQLRARGLELGQGGVEILCLEGDVVHPGAASSEETPHRSVVAGRGHELEPAVPDEQGSGLDPLVDERLATLDLRSEERLVGRDGLVQIGYRHAEMVDAPHAGDAIRACQSRMGSARTIPIVSDERDSGATSSSRAWSSERSSVSFSRSA